MIGVKMRSLTVAATTFRESVRQPVFYFLAVMGTVLLVFAYLLPTFTLGMEEVKFVRDLGLGTYTLCIMLMGIFSAANLITTEIENYTAMTVMSKPLRRHEFVLGKFLGIVYSVTFLGFLLAVVFITVTIAKVAGGDIVLRYVEYEGIWPEVKNIFPGLLIGLLQTFILTAISVALSIRLPMIINVSISFALFVVASISAPLVDSLKGSQGVGYTIARFFYFILPNFQSNTEIYSAIGLGRMVPSSLVGLTAIYSALYIGAALLVAVLLFQERELG